MSPELLRGRRRLAPVPTRPTRHAIGILLLVVLGTLAACSGVGPVPVLTDREFLSVAVTDGGVAKPLVADTRIRLNFREAELGASAGCNSIGGGYFIDRGRLVFEGAGMTEMGCDPARHAQDDWLVELLGSKPIIRLNGDELTLESGSIIVRLLDRKVVEPDVAIVGPTWTVVSIINGDAVSRIPGGATATLVFNADGTLTLNAGCNQGGAKWAAVGGGLQISEIGLTKKACDGAAGTLESAVIGVLGAGTIAAEIESNALTLQAGANGLQLRAG